MGSGPKASGFAHPPDHVAWKVLGNEAPWMVPGRMSRLLQQLFFFTLLGVHLASREPAERCHEDHICSEHKSPK